MQQQKSSLKMLKIFPLKTETVNFQKKKYKF